MDALIYCSPESYCSDDKKWIEEQLTKLPERVRARVVAQYSAVFESEYNNEPITYKKENKARRAANIRLREYVERYLSVTNCKVNSPPEVTQ